MPEYLILFNDEWVTDGSDEEWRERARQARAVVDEAKEAGVFIFSGGLDNEVAVFNVRPEGKTLVYTDGPYAETKRRV